MTVSPEDVKEMDRIKRILNGEITTETAPPAKKLSNGEEAIVFSKGPTSHDVKAMENILKNFHTASTTVEKTVKTLVEESHTDRGLREALITTKTDEGAIIGAWEIKKVIKEGLTKDEETVYQIQNINTGEQIRASFLILESAKLMIKLLNQGAALDHPIIREVAKMEIKYRRLRENALTEKLAWHRAKKKNDEFKCDLYEAKFDAAKAKALYFKERIKNLYYQT